MAFFAASFYGQVKIRVKRTLYVFNALVSVHDVGVQTVKQQRYYGPTFLPRGRFRQYKNDIPLPPATAPNVKLGSPAA